MKLTNMKLSASLSIVFGLIVAGGFLHSQTLAPAQPQNPTYAPPQPGQGGFQIPGRAKMTLLTAPASNSTGLITDPTGTCYAQNYSTFYWNPFTRDLVGCVPASGLASGNSLSGLTNYVAIIRGGGLSGGFSPTTLTGATIAPTYRDTFFNGTTALVTITPTAAVTDGQEITIVFTGSAAGLTWTAAGNINVAGTSTTTGSGVSFVWSATLAKWIPLRLA